MNEMVNKFLLAGDKFMPEIHLRLGLYLFKVVVDHFKKQRKNIKNLEKQKINDIFLKTN